MSDVEINRVRLYACGGAGCNIAKTLDQTRTETVTGFSPLDILYIDTSGSDFDEVDEQYIYRFKDRYGSGGLRKENAPVISRYVQEILQNHKPYKLNIVLSSAGGGKHKTH